MSQFHDYILVIDRWSIYVCHTKCKSRHDGITNTSQVVLTFLPLLSAQSSQHIHPIAANRNSNKLPLLNCSPRVSFFNLAAYHTARESAERWQSFLSAAIMRVSAVRHNKIILLVRIDQRAALCVDTYPSLWRHRTVAFRYSTVWTSWRSGEYIENLGWLQSMSRGSINYHGGEIREWIHPKRFVIITYVRSVA